MNWLCSILGFYPCVRINIQKLLTGSRQILTNNPANTKAKFYLGLTLVELGNKEEARKVLAEVKKEEKDPVIQQAIGELGSRLEQLIIE